MLDIIKEFFSDHYVSQSTIQKLTDHYLATNANIAAIKVDCENAYPVSTYRALNCKFKHLLEAHIRLQLGFKFGIFDPFDYPVLWPESTPLIHQIMNNAFELLLEYCSHHGVIGEEKALTCLFECQKLLQTNTLESLPYVYVLEYVITEMVSSGLVEGELNERTINPNLLVEIHMATQASVA